MSCKWSEVIRSWNCLCPQIQAHECGAVQHKAICWNHTCYFQVWYESNLMSLEIFPVHTNPFCQWLEMLFSKTIYGGPIFRESNGFIKSYECVCSLMLLLLYKGVRHEFSTICECSHCLHSFHKDSLSKAKFHDDFNIFIFKIWIRFFQIIDCGSILVKTELYDLENVWQSIIPTNGHSHTLHASCRVWCFCTVHDHGFFILILIQRTFLILWFYHPYKSMELAIFMW